MKTLVGVFVTFLLSLLIIDAPAQFFNVPKVIENKTNKRINDNIDKGIDKALGETEKGIKGDTTKDNKTVKPAKENENKTDKPKPTEFHQDQPSLQSYSNYDFVAGYKVILFEDFSQDAVGDFPAL
ncbi:MAG: hypothetical protein WCN92_12810 [Eubacteriales bacterium]